MSAVLSRNSQGTFRILEQFYIKSQHRTTEVPYDAGILALVRKGNGRGYLTISAGPRCRKVAGFCLAMKRMRRWEKIKRTTLTRPLKRYGPRLVVVAGDARTIDFLVVIAGETTSPITPCQRFSSMAGSFIHKNRLMYQAQEISLTHKMLWP